MSTANEDRAGWLDEGIGSWLQQLGLEQYEPVFHENAIDLKVLPELTESDLEKIGVLLGHRKRMLRAIAVLDAHRESTDRVLVQGYEPGRPPEGAQRRQLTVVFCDLIGSTPLSIRLDPEDLHEVIAAYHRRVTEIVESFDGFVARYMGDGILVYYGYPHAHEDQAERALRAALEIVDAVPRLDTAGERLAVRIGIATGLVVVGDLLGTVGGENQVVGDTPNLAARLQTLAAPNTALIDAATRQLVGELFEYRDLGAVEVKGYDQPVAIWQVIRSHVAGNRFEGLRRTAATPLIGRNDEIETLLRQWERAKKGNGRVVLIRGEPGIGKSRIAAALQQEISGEQHSRFRLFCSPHHRDSMLHPFIGYMQHAAGFDAEDTVEAKLNKLESALQLIGESSPETLSLFAELMDLPSDRYPPLTSDPKERRKLTLDAIAGQLERVAAQRPVLAVFEDAHWSDPSSLELLDMLVERIANLPVLQLITFRPEFEPPWAGLAHVMLLLLNRLGTQHTAELAKGVAGGKLLPSEIIERIAERTDGIPLFVEELTKTLLEGGFLRETETSYVLDGSPPSLAIPTSLQGSLLARLDRLNRAKRLAEIAAALGRGFSYDLLSAVANWPKDALNEALDQLVAAELVLCRGVPPRANFTFKHALIRDAAYSTLLRRERQQLHARIGQILADKFAGSGEAQPEIIAHHYTEAGLIEPAIKYWRDAGERAQRRWANVEAVKHLSRGIDLLQSMPTGVDRNRTELGLLATLGLAMGALKGYNAGETQQLYSRAQALLDADAALNEQLTVLNGRFVAHFVSAEYDKGREVARQILDLGSRHPAASSLGHRELAEIGWATGQFREAHWHIEQCLEISRCHQWTQEYMRAFVEDHSVMGLAFQASLLWLLGYPEQGVAVGRKSLSMARELDRPSTLAFALYSELLRVGLFEADPDKAKPLADELVSYCKQTGVQIYGVWGSFYHGVAATKKTDPQLGISIMSGVRDALKHNSIRLFAALHSYHLAAAYARCNEHDIALASLREGLQLIEVTGERLCEAELHRLRGEILLEVGRFEEGEAALMNALTIARGQEARMWELRAATSLANYRRKCGKTAEALNLLNPVYGWFGEGLDEPDLVRAKSLLDQLQ